MGGFIAKQFYKTKIDTLTNVPKSFFDITIPLSNTPLKLEDYKGKTKCFLIVNVASK